jgi:g-D-glutamyl-meso-diaminopimelate peptidase
MFDTTEALSPDLTIAWHTQGAEIYWKFLDLAPQGAEALGRQMAAASGYRLSEIPYASSFAGYKDWFIQDFDRPGYTIEAGEGENPLPIRLLGQLYRENLPIFLLGLTGEMEAASEALAPRPVTAPTRAWG